MGIPRKRNRTAKNSVIVRPLKVNWAVFISLINNVSKVITNTVKILKFGTPQKIAIIVQKIEKFDVTLH